MPGGVITVDARNTFAAAIFLGAAQKMQFGTDQPDIAKDGQRKYSADVAVTYLAEPGRKPVSEVISVSVMGTDPSATIAPGSPVEFDGLRAGVSVPARNERGGVSGGRMWFSASAIRPAAPANGRQMASAKAE
jgi:hypothetical protein